MFKLQELTLRELEKERQILRLKEQKLQALEERLSGAKPSINTSIANESFYSTSSSTSSSNRFETSTNNVKSTSSSFSGESGVKDTSYESREKEVEIRNRVKAEIDKIRRNQKTT